LAGLQRRHDHGIVHTGRGADIDHVDVVHGEQIVIISDAAFDAKFIADLLEAFRIQVAKRQNLELVVIVHIAFDDMRAADAAADEGAVEYPAHFPLSLPSSALAWAVSAIFMAL